MAGLLSIPGGSKAFSQKNSYSNEGSVSINLGKTKGIIYVTSPSLNGDKIKCFMVQSTSVEIIGSALDPTFENQITASISNGNLIVTAKTISGSGFVNLYVWHF